MIDVILLERVEKLGIMGDVVKVKPGYARNFLLPQKKALRATKENITFFESQKAQLEASNIKLREEAEKVAKRMDGLKLVMIRQAGESEQLYGSVNSNDIAKALTDAGYTVARSQVQIDRPIKYLGLHPVLVRLHPEVAIQVIANVAKTEEEAQMQAEGKKVRADEEEAENAEQYEASDAETPVEAAAEEATEAEA